MLSWNQGLSIYFLELKNIVTNVFISFLTQSFMHFLSEKVLINIITKRDNPVILIHLMK